MTWKIIFWTLCSCVCAKSFPGNCNFNKAEKAQFFKQPQALTDKTIEINLQIGQRQ